jgi:NADH dehydrogenase
MRHQTIAIIGGTGFIGRQLAAELGRRRYRIRVITRRRERNRQLLVIPSLEQVEADVHSSSSLSAALAGCDAVVNLVGILKGRDARGESFEDVHARLPNAVADAASFNRITRLLHMSALGASADAPSQYLRSKAAGEAAAHAREGMAVTSFRPSVVFGPEDAFVNLFASLLRVSPLVFPLACPEARFAPVYVGDVAHAFAECLENDATAGGRYELCGPRSYTLRELVEYIATVQGLRRYVLPLPDALGRLQARVAGLVPGVPLSMDSYRSMQVPSVCSEDGLGRLGIQATSLEAVVPAYLGGRSTRGQFTRLRSSAGRELPPRQPY